jgi:hypothetical protein
MSPLTELDAFFTDHRQCGDLDAGVGWRGRLDRVRLPGGSSPVEQTTTAARYNDS